MKDNGIWMLRKVVLYKATIITYSKLNTDKLNEEEIFLAAPQETGQDTRGEVLEQAARNYCYANELTPSSIKIIPVFDQPTFDIVEADRSVIERKKPLVVSFGK